VAGELNKKIDPDLSGAHFYVFDLLRLEEFKAKKSERTLSERLAHLEGLFEAKQQIVLEPNPTPLLEDFHFKLGKGRIWAIQQLKVPDKQWLQALRKITNGWEGFMMRKDVEYVGKRRSAKINQKKKKKKKKKKNSDFLKIPPSSRDLIKVKNFYDAEYTVTGIKSGPISVSFGKKSEVRTALSAITILHKGFPFHQLSEKGSAPSASVLTLLPSYLLGRHRGERGLRLHPGGEIALP
jgi:ATP-dependent DNA ligase